MIECKVCHGNCDPGEIVSGICLECLEEEQKKKMQRKSIATMFNSPFSQMELFGGENDG